MSASAKRAKAKVEVVRRSARFERIRARVPRYLFVGTAVLLAGLGLRELVAPAKPGPAAAVRVGVDHASEHFAQQFARAYLAHDSSRPASRERALQGLVPDELAVDAGLLARRDQEVLWTAVAQRQEAIAGGEVVVVAAGVSTQPTPIYLAVPVYRQRDGAVGLAGYPSLVGPPIVSRAGLADREEVEDREVVSVVRRVVANYIAGEAQNLAADLAPAAQVSMPTRELRLASVDEVAWASGVGSSAVLATVVARDRGGATWTLTYELGIEHKGGRPYVSFVETVPNAP